MNRSLIAGWSALLLAFLQPHAPAQEWQEYLINGSFTEGTSGWKSSSSGGNSGKATVDETRPFDQRATLKMEVAPDSKEMTLYQTFAVEGGRLYRLRASYQTGTTDGKLMVRFAFIKEDGGNGSAGVTQVVLPSGRNEGWSETEQFVYMPEEAVHCQIAVSVQGGGSSAWIGNLSFQQEEAYPILPKEALQKKGALGGFWQLAKADSPAKQATHLEMTYNAHALEFTFINDEPFPNELQATAKERDDPAVHFGDCNEILIAAPGGTVRQFAIASNGVQWDASLYLKAEGDPYRPDASWNGEWKAKVTKEEGRWISHWSIPWKDLGIEPTPGLKLKMNFVRQRQVGEREVSQWNHSEGSVNTVEKFAEFELLEKDARLTRYIEAIEDAPLRVERSKRHYLSLLNEQPGNYLTGDWAYAYYLASYPKAFRENYNPEKWKPHQIAILAEMGKHGLFGPAFPWVSQVGWEELEKVHQEWGMKFPFYLGLSTASRIARENGAKLICPRHSAVSDIDPEKRRAMKDYLQGYLEKHPQAKPLLLVVKGTDEPSNTMYTIFSKTLHGGGNAALDDVEKEILSSEGVGRFGLYDHFDSAAAASTDTPFKRIAFNRWWSRRMGEAAREIQAFVKEIVPEVPVQVFQHNTVSGITPGDLHLMSRDTDWVSVDPYPTATLRSYGRARALYHTGFATKLISDIAEGKTVQAILQGFEYHGRSPGPEEVREWASQALKSGADVINWYTMGPSRHKLPETYEEILSISQQVHRMNRLVLPERTQTAILLSTSSQSGLDDPVLHGCYTLYTLLGERVGSWFKIVSETAIIDSAAILEKKKLLYLPQASYFNPKAAANLVKQVEAGATLVIFDPLAFAQGDDESDLSTVRERLIGTEPGPRINAASITLKAGAFPGMDDAVLLPLTPVANLSRLSGIIAHQITPPDDATVIATYPDGTPAAFRRRVGNGEVFYFSAQPFGNSALAASDSLWPSLFRAMAKTHGEAMDLPIWNFYLEKQ